MSRVIKTKGCNIHVIQSMVGLMLGSRSKLIMAHYIIIYLCLDLDPNLTLYNMYYSSVPVAWRSIYMYKKSGSQRRLANNHIHVSKEKKTILTSLRDWTLPLSALSLVSFCKVTHANILSYRTILCESIIR